ncbi:MAG: hypothetical protein EXS13_14195 [Planctomycetes bacterium]|nr:hypothetical protein [Planctomycetota bacterium]
MPHWWRAGGVAAVVVALGSIASAQDPAPAANSAAWVVMKPVKLVSAGDATFTPQADGSLLVSGANPDKDVWTLDFESELRGITALRLEALPDDSLPSRGPGRAGNGNFVLNEVEFETSAKLALRFKSAALVNASCDFIEGHRRATDVHDGERNSGGNGWAIYGSVGNPHVLMAELQKPVDFGGPALFRLTCHFNWGSQHSLGRFRLSATTQPRPVRVGGAAAEESFGQLQERINRAIDRGVEWLVAHQAIDGSWNHEQWSYRNGCTALSMYTLLKSGVNKRHPAVQRAREFLRSNPSRETYTIGCHLMALGAYDDPEDLPWMKALVDTLLSFQRGGAFNYPWGGADLSNTQYGVLGLRAAAQHGVEVPASAFDKAAQQVLQWSADETKGAYGALAFTYNGGQKPTSSMTAAGTTILAVAEQELKGKSKSGGYLGTAKRGVQWLADHYTVNDNINEGHDRWDLYYLYGLERVASLLDLDKIGGHDWYREGATHLCDHQGDKGQWGSSYGDHPIDTCFALLFLNRATAPVSGQSSPRVRLYGGDDPAEGVSVRASGDTPLTMWISGFGDAALAAHEWPSDKDRGLRVLKVEWFACGAKLGDGEKPIALIEKDGLQPAGRERFGAQWTFALPGDYSVRVRVTVMAPPTEPGGAALQVVLESMPLVVRIEEALDPELLQCAKDPGVNLLFGQKVSARASTTLNGDWSPDRAVDNLQCRGWAAASDDPIPNLTIELEKPVRANTLVLTPARIGDTWQSRITKLAITFNGKQPPLLVDVPVTEEQKKLRLRLIAPIVVRKVEVKVLSKQESPNNDKAVGFAEVELQVEQRTDERAVKPDGN